MGLHTIKLTAFCFPHCSKTLAPLQNNKCIFPPLKTDQESNEKMLGALLLLLSILMFFVLYTFTLMHLIFPIKLIT